MGIFCCLVGWLFYLNGCWFFVSKAGYRRRLLSVSGDCQLVPLSPSYHTSVRQCGPTGLDEEDHYHKGGDGHAAI